MRTEREKKTFIHINSAETLIDGASRLCLSAEHHTRVDCRPNEYLLGATVSDCGALVSDISLKTQM